MDFTDVLGQQQGTITDVLYWDYATNRSGTDSEEVRAILNKLDAQFDLFQRQGILNATDRNALYDLVLQVCDLHRKEGFDAGMRTFYQLEAELKYPCKSVQASL